MPSFEVLIASPPDRIGVVAELWYGDQLWAELRHEGPDFLLEVYPPPGGETWLFDAEEAIGAIREARERLKPG